MNAWILIVAFPVAVPDGGHVTQYTRWNIGNGVAMQEFSDRKSCDLAVMAVTSISQGSKALCVPKAAQK